MPHDSSATLRLELFVSDIARSCAFYRDALGFEESGRNGDYAAMRLGAVTLGLGMQDGLPTAHHFSQEALRGRKGVGVEIVLEVDDVTASYDRAVASGCAIATPLGTRPWGLTDYRIIDPDGYYIRVTSR